MDSPINQPFLETLEEKLILAQNIGLPADELQNTYETITKFKESIDAV